MRLWAAALVIALSVAGPTAAQADGAAWADVLPGKTVWAVAVDPSDERVVYAAGADGLFKSTDEGTTWARISDKPLGRRLIIDQHTPATLYATVGRPSSSEVLPISFDTEIVRSDDGGASWRSLRTEPIARITDVALDPNRRGTLYATISGGGPRLVVRSLDGGNTWTAITDPMLVAGISGGSPYTSSVAMLPGSPDLLYVGLELYHFGCIWKAADATASPWPGWSCLPLPPRAAPTAPNPFEYSTPTFVRAGGTSQAHVVYAFWVGADYNNAFTRYDDDGPIIDLTASLPFASQRESSTLFTAITLHPAKPDRVYAAIQRIVPSFELPLRVREQGAFFSADRGQAWKELGHLDAKVYDLALAPSTRMLYAATDHGIARFPLASNTAGMPVAGGGGMAAAQTSPWLLVVAGLIGCCFLPRVGARLHEPDRRLPRGRASGPHGL